MHKFNEHHPDLKGFSAYFEKDVAPLLSAREAERRDKINKAKTYGVGIIALGILLIIIVKILRRDGGFDVTIMMATGAGLVGMYYYLFKEISVFTKQQIVDGICHYVGWTFVAKPDLPPDLTAWTRLFLIPNGYEKSGILGGKTVKYEDQISGLAHGADFNSVELKLTRQSGKRTVTDFQAQLMTITFPRKFSARTLVLRDKGRFQRKAKSDMKRVGLVDPIFENIFEAYSTDQVEARYLLDPVFMQKLVDLETSVNGKNIRFAFYDSQLFIAIETNDRYEAGSMFKSLLDPERTQRILNEIVAIFNVIDGVIER